MNIRVDPYLVGYFCPTSVLRGDFFGLVFGRGCQHTSGKDNFTAACVHAYVGKRHMGILVQSISDRFLYGSSLRVRLLVNVRRILLCLALCWRNLRLGLLARRESDSQKQSQYRQYCEFDTIRSHSGTLLINAMGGNSSAQASAVGWPEYG